MSEGRRLQGPHLGLRIEDSGAHHFVLMPDPGVTSFVEANELRPGNSACGVLRAGVGAVAIVTPTDDQRRCAPIR
jgi:hypothetical protein